MRPEDRTILPDQPQLALLAFAGRPEVPLVQVVNVLVRLEDEAADRLLEQRAAGRAQQAGGGGVGLQDQPLLGQGDVAHRGQVIKVEIARPFGFDQRLRRAQFLVLHLQLDLVYLKFMEKFFVGTNGYLNRW